MAGIERLTVTLPADMAAVVKGAVAGGDYASASEVVREALRLLEERDRAHALRLAEFNAEIGRRLTALDRGESVGPAEALAKLRRKSRKARMGRS